MNAWTDQYDDLGFPWVLLAPPFSAPGLEVEFWGPEPSATVSLKLFELSETLPNPSHNISNMFWASCSIKSYHEDAHLRLTHKPGDVAEVARAMKKTKSSTHINRCCS